MVFRLLALASPIVLLLLVELVLRLLGYGYPTSFFIPDPGGRQGIYVDNQYFGWRFFPRAAARSPLPVEVTVPKPAGTFRVLVLGESAAMGDPEPAYGFARQLERMLALQKSGKKVEVLNLAMTAINSHVIREIARDAAFLHADTWILYAGNNEVVGPFGAGTVFGRQAAPVWFVRAQLWLRRFRFAQLLDAALQRDSRGLEWTGMEMFLKHRVPHTDPRLLRVQQNFAANLAEIIHLGKRAGAQVFVATMAVNLADCPPFGSAHKASLDADSLASWEQAFQAGVQAQSAGRTEEALQHYTVASGLDDAHAELAFRMARCFAESGDTTNARAHFILARDRDVLRFRADSGLDRATRGGAKGEKAVLIDAAERISQPIQNEDSSLFHDHVHLNFEGNHRLATLFAQALMPQLGANPPALPDAETIARSLAHTPYDERRVIEEMRERMRHPPFTLQLNHPGRDAALTQRLRTALEEPPAAHIPSYRAAIQEFPDDWVLHARFARLLESCGDRAGARAEWETVSRLIPHVPDPSFHLGDIALGENRPEDARDLFRKALELKPGMVEGLNGLGLAYSALGQSNPAKDQFRQALAIKPSYAAARVNLATELARSGQTDAAAVEFNRVLSMDTHNVAARINLGKLLATQNNHAEAVRLFREALTLDTSNSISWFNLGNTLSALGNRTEAVECYRAALTNQPAFIEARYELAMELTRLHRIPEALPQLAEVVRLKPSMTEAHFNYGIALARQGKLDLAAQEFRATLDQNPRHPQARESLEKALQLVKRTESSK